MQKNNKSAGFTLFEMTVIMVVAGILLSLLGATLLAYSSGNRIKTTEVRSEGIQKALSHYLSVNGRYPCVARWDLGVDNNNFGREVTASCDSGSMTGTAQTTDVRIGAVPTRTLNLPDEFAADGWGRKFTFAMTKSLATSGRYRSDEGEVSISNRAGTVFLSDAHYVVVSHGQTGIGARDYSYENSGTANPVVPCAAADLDEENCDNDDVFMSTLVNTTKNDPAFFDDYAFYKGLTLKGLTKSMAVPTGAVLPFNTASCPPGWTRLFRAEEGFVIGAGVPQSITGHAIPTTTEAKISKDQYQILPESTASSNVGVNSIFGVTTSPGPANGNSQKGNIPPYIALLYCEKLPD